VRNARRMLLSALFFLSAFVALSTNALAQTDLVVDGADPDPTLREITLGGIHTYNTVRVINGGRILVPTYDGSDRINTGNLQIRANSIFIDPSSSIIADGRGYQPRLCDHGRGPAGTLGGGRGGCAVLDSGGGGAHFGAGGRGTKDCFCYGNASTCTFPDEFSEACGYREGNSCVSIDGASTALCGREGGSDPTGTCLNLDGTPSVAGQPYTHSIYEIEFGAAGGDKGCRDGWESCTVGGPGGGRIVLAAINDSGVGSLDIRGRVSAEGYRGCGRGNDSGGGGAGGSLLLVGETVSIAATAYISAAGGLGGDTNAKGDPNGHCPSCAQDPGGTCDDCGGGGGGGIISVQSGSPATIDSLARFDVSGALGGTCTICQGEAGGGAGELQLSGKYVGEVCDGYDNDFDGQIDENLGQQSCGSGACQQTVNNCSGGLPNDCIPLAQQSCQAPLTDTRSRFMVIVDTSASMLGDLAGYPTFGDGSANHPGIDKNGDSQANDSRLYKAKQALTQVISAYPEIDFGLARFAQSVDTNIACQLAHWFECAGLCCSYDNPTDNTGGTPPGGACNVQLSSNPSDTIAVQPTSTGDECINYAGSCGPPRRGADVLVGFQRPIQQSLMWLDHRETNFLATTTEGNHCSGGDCELRGTGPTPLAGSLQAVLAYLAKVRAEDQVSSCRRYATILLTDGTETCGGNPVQAATDLLAAGVETYVVGFSVLASEQAALNAIANAGSTSGTRNAFFVGDEAQLAAALAQIVADSVVFETCNNLDDDCDLQVDEDFPLKGQACNNGLLGECFRTGVYECRADGSGVQCNATTPTPGTEICDGKDNDCDGQIDEDAGCTPCVPQIEVCNGRDDDCDGQIDEDFVSSPCGSDVGSCARGNTACVLGQVVCQGATGPTDEICDNLDNNCDTIIDNFAEPCFTTPTGTAFTHGCNVAAGTCVGSCRLGSHTCTAGSFGSCQNAIGPTTEICNYQDDDCDGQVDEGLANTCYDYNTCNTYPSCGACPQAPAEVCDGKDNDCNGAIDDITPGPCGTNTGECKKGTTACVGGKLVCQGEIGPQPETCDGKDNDCNGAVDDAIPGLGGTCGATDQGECKLGTLQCVGGQTRCVGEIGPKAEICDGKDNDCNGSVDDNVADVGKTCGIDTGECTRGTTACVNGKLTCQGGQGPTPELCDGKDNDCNGIPDDNPTDVGSACGSSVGVCRPGVEQCISGKLVCIGAAVGSGEICDGLDNDCNGTVDDNIATVGDKCGTDVGECKSGVIACDSVKQALICQGGVPGTPEVCDGKDNDCDNDIDEDFPEKGQTCGNQGIGECAAGNWICDNGQLKCDGGALPQKEVCDGKDNDCNGAIDDNVPGEGDACQGDKTSNAQRNVGECKDGKLKCVSAKMICVGATNPDTEICDGKDNDCDGQPDNEAACPGDSRCIEGACRLPCGSGEFRCPGGTACKNGYCEPDPCATVECTDTQRCIGGTCIEKCQGVDCEDHEKCDTKTGLCVDDSCLTKGCPPGQTCISYQCVDDPCPPGKCPQDQMCADGNCVDTCENVTCPSGQTCVAGKCSDNPCEGYKCQENFVCKVNDDGKASCVGDPCAMMRCTQGQICREGKCQDDPCLRSTCPPYLRCEVSFTGLANCVPRDGIAQPRTYQYLCGRRWRLLRRRLGDR
jgi:hypothetical protein